MLTFSSIGSNAVFSLLRGIALNSVLDELPSWPSMEAVA